MTPVHEVAHFIWYQLPAEKKEEWYRISARSHMWSCFEELPQINRPQEEAFCLTAEVWATDDEFYKRIYQPSEEQITFFRQAMAIAERCIADKLELYRKNPVKALQRYAIEERMERLGRLIILRQAWGQDPSGYEQQLDKLDRKYRQIIKVLYPDIHSS